MRKATSVLLLLVGLGFNSPAWAGWGSGGYHSVHESVIWQGRMTPGGAIGRDLVNGLLPIAGDVVRSGFRTGQDVETTRTPSGVLTTRRDYPSPPRVTTSLPSNHFQSYGEGVRQGLALKGKPVPPEVVARLKTDQSFARGFWDMY